MRTTLSLRYNAFPFLVFFLCGIGVFICAEAAGSNAIGVSVSGDQVVIDGVALDPSVKVYISPTTGMKYFISRKDGSVSVTSSKTKASSAKGERISIEASAEDGATVNSGYAVISK